VLELLTVGTIASLLAGVVKSVLNRTSKTHQIEIETSSGTRLKTDLSPEEIELILQQVKRSSSKPPVPPQASASAM
jgi:hypothetical protein